MEEKVLWHNNNNNWQPHSSKMELLGCSVAVKKFYIPRFEWWSFTSIFHWSSSSYVLLSLNKRALFFCPIVHSSPRWEPSLIAAKSPYLMYVCIEFVSQRRDMYTEIFRIFRIVPIFNIWKFSGNIFFFDFLILLIFQF